MSKRQMRAKSKELKYYPCVYDARKCLNAKKVSQHRMTKDEAETYLKKHHLSLWLKCEAQAVCEDDPVLLEHDISGLKRW